MATRISSSSKAPKSKLKPKFKLKRKPSPRPADCKVVLQHGQEVTVCFVPGRKPRTEQIRLRPGHCLRVRASMVLQASSKSPDRKL